MRFGRVLAMCALLLPPGLAVAAETAPSSWILVMGNGGVTTMGDVNSAIGAVNSGSALLGTLGSSFGFTIPTGSMESVSLGYGAGGMAGVDFKEHYSLGFGYDYVTAGTKLNATATAVQFRFPANLVHADFMYHLRSGGPFDLGFGVAAGMITARAKIDGTLAGAGIPVISLSASGPMYEGFLTGDLKASRWFAITPMAGYRYAKTGNVKLWGQEVPIPLDYSGGFARLGLKLMFQ